jgi:hypothetical protein
LQTSWEAHWELGNMPKMHQKPHVFTHWEFDVNTYD